MGVGAFLWALGTVPLAMAGGGALAVGPEPWALLPIRPVQVFIGTANPWVGGRIRLLRGPWFAWAEAPPLRLALGRAIAPAWLAVVGGSSGVNLAWELQASPELSLFGALGGETACGVRVRGITTWAAALIRGGGLTLWCGLYF